MHDHPLRLSEGAWEWRDNYQVCIWRLKNPIPIKYFVSVTATLCASHCKDASYLGIAIQLLVGSLTNNSSAELGCLLEFPYPKIIFYWLIYFAPSPVGEGNAMVLADKSRWVRD